MCGWADSLGLGNVCVCVCVCVLMGGWIEDVCVFVCEGVFVFV